jgi:hypothetical protein
MMRNLILAVFLLSSFSVYTYGQTRSINCDSTLLDKGRKFTTPEPKSLEGDYDFTIVPTWDPQARRATGKLHLYWEERYEAMQNNQKFRVPQKFPLIGYIEGDFSKAMILNFNEDMNRKDPMNPGVRYFDDKGILKVPGEEPVDPSCQNCINICADCPMLTFEFKKIINGTIVGIWSHDMGIMKIKNSGGKWVNEATGFFCAEPQN